MIDYLVVSEDVGVDVFGFECPLEVEAGGILVFVFHPSTGLQRLLHVFVASLNYEYLGPRIYSILLLPGCHISYVQEDLVFLQIAFQEVVNCRAFGQHFFLGFEFFGRLVTLVISAVLLVP